MAGMNQVTAETLSMLKPSVKKALSEGITTELGLTGYQLEEPSKKLFPVWATFRNSVPRVHAAAGSMAAHWKAITRINATRRRPTVGFGVAGSLVTTETQEYQSNYYPVSLGDSVIMDAQMLAQGFEDLRATGGINLLYALMIEEDRMLLGAQNFSTPKPPKAVLTNSNSGGSIAHGLTVHVRAVARNYENYYYGGGTEPSDDVSVATDDTADSNKITAVIPALDQYGAFDRNLAGVVAYDWYVSADGTNYFYYTTTAVNTVEITAIPTEDNPEPDLPELFAHQAWNEAQSDTSADTKAFNGLLATLSGAYLEGAGAFVSPGTTNSVPSGTVFASNEGNQLHASGGTIQEIDDVIIKLWDKVQLSPTRILVSGQQIKDIVHGIVKSGEGGGGTYKFVQASNPAEARALHAGYAVVDYTNPIFPDQPIHIQTMPHLMPGTIIVITETLPYPNNQTANVLEVETQQEYQQIEYAMSRREGNNGGPRYDFEVRAIETFKNYFPSSMAVIQNVGSGDPVIA
jgi:hypothetical protein